MNIKKQTVILSAGIALAFTGAPDLQGFQSRSKTRNASPIAKADSAAKVEVLGLTVDRDINGPEQQPGMTTMRFGQFVDEGTSVTLLVTQPGKAIIGFDPKASKLTSFTDDKKADLSKAKRKPKNKGFVINFGDDDSAPLIAENSPDGHSFIIKVRGPALPTSGASKITIKANLVFNCSAAEKTVEKKNVNLAAVTKIHAGSIPITVKPGQGGGFRLNFPGQPAAQPATEITLEMDQPISAIKSVAFLDAGGQDIKSQTTGTSTNTFGNNVRTTSGYALEKKFENVTIRVTFFETERLSVPIDLTVDVGF